MNKHTWKEYFIFSKKQRIATTVLLLLMLLNVVVICFYNPYATAPDIQFTALEEALPTTEANAANTGVNTTDTAVANTPQLFVFDPNTIDEAGLRRLGLRDKTISTIVNYRNKGGHFRRPEDLKKIYGLNAAEAERLMPFVQIAAAPAGFTNAYNNKHTYVKPEIIDINKATVEQWKALPAIGDALSNRIVKYRDRIGGFKSIEQVKETYGITDSTFQVIKPYLMLSAAVTPAGHSGKININTATAAQLKSNTNISAAVAEAIIIYRGQHGNYTSVADIKKIVFINDEMYNKVAPYLSVE